LGYVFGLVGIAQQEISQPENAFLMLGNQR
jgi:hypothetical protein